MRIKSGVTTRAHKKKYFKLAKGNYSAKRSRWRMVKQQVEASLAESYIGRKDKKGDFRSLWIERINAACRLNDAASRMAISDSILRLSVMPAFFSPPMKRL